MAAASRLARVENLEARQMLTGMDFASSSLAQFAINGNSCGTAEIDFVEVGGGGDSADGGEYEGGNYFVADSFSFGVEREMKESGEKGGTEDINIGLGELDECSTEAVDAAFADLADDRPNQEVAFYYNKIASSYAMTKDGKDFSKI